MRAEPAGVIVYRVHLALKDLKISKACLIKTKTDHLKEAEAVLEVVRHQLVQVGRVALEAAVQRAANALPVPGGSCEVVMGRYRSV